MPPGLKGAIKCGFREPRCQLAVTSYQFHVQYSGCNIFNVAGREFRPGGVLNPYYFHFSIFSTDNYLELTAGAEIIIFNS